MMPSTPLSIARFASLQRLAKTSVPIFGTPIGVNMLLRLKEASMSERKGKSSRGFGAMDPKKRREAASKGGRKIGEFKKFALLDCLRRGRGTMKKARE